MAGRKAAFIGSEEWKKRDVVVGLSGVPTKGAVRITDKPTGIWLQFSELTAASKADSLFAELAHRVLQLS